jgi:hypothetical protein
MAVADLPTLLKRVIELVMPDLRSYYRVTRKARVVKTYASDGHYWADVQPLRNDESVDEREPVIPRVEIPVVWAGPKRGIVCPPAVGTLCDLTYYDGDPDYPRISNFRWHGMAAPEVEIGGFIIQRGPGTHIKINAANNIICVTPADKQNVAGGSKTEEIGGIWSIQVAGTATIQAPQVEIRGLLSVTDAAGGPGASTLVGDLHVTGNIVAEGTITDAGGNTNHHSHS